MRCCAASDELDGINYPNYHYEYLERLATAYLHGKYENPAVVVDCNHDNSGEAPAGATRIVNEVLDSVSRSADIAKIFPRLHGRVLHRGRQPARGQRRLRQVDRGRLHRVGRRPSASYSTWPTGSSRHAAEAAHTCG